MVPTGDIQGGLRKLETLIRTIKYTGPVNYNGLSSGNPAAFLPIVSFMLTSFSPIITEQLVMSGFELSGKTDLRFIETVYKVLRDVFQYKPVLTKEQFLHWGFAQRKISVVCDIIHLVMQKHNQHQKSKPRPPASNKNVKVETIFWADQKSAVPAKPIVVNHLENPHLIPATSPPKVASVSSKAVNIEVEEVDLTADEGQEDSAVKQCCVELQERLKALEARIEDLVSGLDRIGLLEQRLEELQGLTKDKSEKQTITVSRETWHNLLTRVFMLETKLELNGAKENIPPERPESYASNACVVQQPSVKCLNLIENDSEILAFPEQDNQDDLEQRLERITKMLKSTSSLLKSNKNSTTND